MKQNKDAREYSADELAERAQRRKNITAFVVCILIAALLWLIIMNIDQSAQPSVPADTDSPAFLELPGGNQ